MARMAWLKYLSVSIVIPSVIIHRYKAWVSEIWTNYGEYCTIGSCMGRVLQIYDIYLMYGNKELSIDNLPWKLLQNILFRTHINKQLLVVV
jgi:hypothetical protein